jgi:hypothetical protein
MESFKEHYVRNCESNSVRANIKALKNVENRLGGVCASWSSIGLDGAQVKTIYHFEIKKNKIKKKSFI